MSTEAPATAFTNPIFQFVDKIFCINLKRRTDRFAHACEVFRKIGISPQQVHWFDGVDKPIDSEGRPNGNLGCTTSHRKILDIICKENFPRALVFEDDVDIAFTDPAQCSLDHRVPGRGRRVDPQKLFAVAMPEIPDKWDMLYLGGHYAEMPMARFSRHLIKVGRMHTTSSYVITASFAAKIRESITGVGPIDVLYSGFLRDNDCYCLDPRMFCQMRGFSDLSEEDYNPSHAMTDNNHVKALDAGTTYP